MLKQPFLRVVSACRRAASYPSPAATNRHADAMTNGPPRADEDLAIHMNAASGVHGIGCKVCVQLVACRVICSRLKCHGCTHHALRRRSTLYSSPFPPHAVLVRNPQCMHSRRHAARMESCNANTCLPRASGAYLSFCDVCIRRACRVIARRLRHKYDD